MKIKKWIVDHKKHIKFSAKLLLWSFTAGVILSIFAELFIYAVSDYLGYEFLNWLARNEFIEFYISAFCDPYKL